MTDRSFDDDEWNPHERERLAAVGRHRSARAGLKSRTMDALQEQGLIGSRRRWPLVRTIGLAAAAVVVFASGVVAGYGFALRRDDGRVMTKVTSTPAREVARADTLSATNAAGRHVVWF